MTTEAENGLLTATGPDTPCGKLMRHYWQPVALSEELVANRPMPVKILGEELVLFRDDTGAPGLLGLYCAHRCADLSYGRIENGGLRCLYHGWLYDRAGRCLEQPAEPKTSTFKDKIRHKAYPCREAGGAVFAYMGPGEPPLFPNFHFLCAPAPLVYQSKVFHACNYLQATEGDIDPAHLSFLHAHRPPQKDGRESTLQSFINADNSPRIDAERTRFGIRIYTRRRAEAGKSYLRITNLVIPNIGFFAGQTDRVGPGGYSVHWHVPIDDVSHWRYDFAYHAGTPVDKEALRAREAAEIDETHHALRTPDNRYRQDRAQMKETTFSGMGNYFTSHDLFAVQSPGPIHDRTRENLATTDVPIAMARRMLLDAIKGLQAGREPPLVLRSPNENVFNDIVVVGAVLDEGEDPRAYCRAVVESGDFHAPDIA